LPGAIFLLAYSEKNDILAWIVGKYMDSMRQLAADDQKFCMADESELRLSQRIRGGRDAVQIIRIAQAIHR
jgi:hypothetical protein